MTIAPAGAESPLGAEAELDAEGALELVVAPPVLELDAELPELMPDDVPEAELLEETEEPAENGLADPDPQPTMEAMAKAATLN
ncbi:MAG TPA: hypothetical protein VM912_09120 [Terriglobales bacterium]|nr:hypothetical protein [Terriglobales bacterium]